MDAPIHFYYQLFSVTIEVKNIDGVRVLSTELIA